ncbi:hypothetical protein MMC13_002107 [Lambiella insularis]|nr:hypothetical protein [Lambiella insularis]
MIVRRASAVNDNALGLTTGDIIGVVVGIVVFAVAVVLLVWVRRKSKNAKQKAEQGRGGVENQTRSPVQGRAKRTGATPESRLGDTINWSCPPPIASPWTHNTSISQLQTAQDKIAQRSLLLSNISNSSPRATGQHLPISITPATPVAVGSRADSQEKHVSSIGSRNRPGAAIFGSLDEVKRTYTAEQLLHDERSASSVYSEYPCPRSEFMGPSDTTVSSEANFQGLGGPVTEEFRRRHQRLLAQGYTPSEIMLASEGSEGTNGSTAGGGLGWPGNGKRYGNLGRESKLTAPSMKPQPLRIRKERLNGQGGLGLGIGHLSKELDDMSSCLDVTR